jgi:hypothetical protein
MSVGRTFYRYRSFDLRTLDSLCHDTLHFALPSGFNDPFDSRPTLTCDSSLDELRNLLEHLIRRRATAEFNESLRRLRIRGQKATLHASKNADSQVRQALADIAYHATNPDYEDGPEKAEEWLLTSEIERELLRHYERGVCCFSVDYKNPLLWSHYGDQHRGLCAGYSTNRVPKPQVQRVVYGGDRSIETSLLLDAFCRGRPSSKKALDRNVLLRKAIDWRYEREWRLIGETGVQESPLLLTEIVFGLRCPEAVKYSVVQALSGRQKPVFFYQMNETRSRYALQRGTLQIEDFEMHFPHVAVSGAEMFGTVEVTDQKTAKKKRN